MANVTTTDTPKESAPKVKAAKNASSNKKTKTTTTKLKRKVIRWSAEEMDLLMPAVYKYLVQKGTPFPLTGRVGIPKAFNVIQKRVLAKRRWRDNIQFGTQAGAEIRKTLNRMHGQLSSPRKQAGVRVTKVNGNGAHTHLPVPYGVVTHPTNKHDEQATAALVQYMPKYDETWPTDMQKLWLDTANAAIKLKHRMIDEANAR